MALSLSINNDVMWEILSHLPVLSLLRFRTVCKSWRDVIDSPCFRRVHLQNQIDNRNDDDSVFLLFKFLEREIWLVSTMPKRNLIMLPFPGNVETNAHFDEVVRPVNGLICVYTTTLMNQRRLWLDLPITICNPSLGIVKNLPPSPLCSINPCEIVPYSRRIVICFDKPAHDYKVVQLLICKAHGRVHAELYSRRTNSWRVLGDVDNIPHSAFLCMYVDSSNTNPSFLHWEAYRRLDEGGPFKHILVTFDEKNEVFEVSAMVNFPGFARFGSRTKMFAKDDSSSFLLFTTVGREAFPTKEEVNTRLAMCEGKRDRNTLRWEFVRYLGPFPGLTEPVALWKSDCLVLKHCGEREDLISLYDFRAGKFLPSFEMTPARSFECFEYQGSFVSP